MNWWVPMCVAALSVSGCCTCPPKTGVTPKPDITPVKQSNVSIKKSIGQTRQSIRQGKEVNKSSEQNLDVIGQDLQKLLHGK